MTATALPPSRHRSRLAALSNLALPLAAAALAASAAYAGADATFAPALTKFTYSFRSIYVPTRFGYTRNR